MHGLVYEEAHDLVFHMRNTNLKYLHIILPIKFSDIQKYNNTFNKQEFRETGTLINCRWEYKLALPLQCDIAVSTEITNVHTITPYNSISRNLSYRYTCTCAK